MANTSRDDNRVTATLGVSSADGVTPVPIKVNPTNGAILCADIGSGDADVVGNRITRDDNRVTVSAGVSSVDNSPIPFHIKDGLLMES